MFLLFGVNELQISQSCHRPVKEACPSVEKQARACRGHLRVMAFLWRVWVVFLKRCLSEWEYRHLPSLTSRKLCVCVPAFKLPSCYNYIIQNKTINSFSDRDTLKLPQNMCVGSSTSAAALGNPGKANPFVGGRAGVGTVRWRGGNSPTAHRWPAVRAPFSHSL